MKLHSLEKILEFTKVKGTEAVGAIVAFTPLLATIETRIAQMSNDVSIRSRVYNGAANLLIIPFLLEGRDISKKVFKITKESSEKAKNLHDSLYSMTCALVMKPTVYMIAGETDWKKIAIGTLAGMGAGYLIGGPLLYFVDVFKDLVGVQKSERAPKWLSDLGSRTKKAIAGGLIAASLLITSMVYVSNHYLPNSRIFHKEMPKAIASEHYDAQARTNEKYSRLITEE